MYAGLEGRSWISDRSIYFYFRETGGWCKQLEADLTHWNVNGTRRTHARLPCDVARRG